jgi:hypothetical protein
MDFAGRYINSGPSTKSFFLDLAAVEAGVVFWVGDCECTSANEVGCKTIMRVRRVVSITSKLLELVIHHMYYQIVKYIDMPSV